MIVKNMKDSLILEGKIYISARRAAKIINYAQDYIGQLCRQGKLDSRMVGRSWFVTEESLLAHREAAIDATTERVAKIIGTDAIEENAKRDENKISENIQTNVNIPVKISANEIKSEIKSEIKNEIKYISEKDVTPVVMLPAIVKKVPALFSLPTSIDLYPSPYFSKNPLKKIEGNFLKNISTPNVDITKIKTVEEASTLLRDYHTTNNKTLATLAMILVFVVGGYTFSLASSSKINLSKEGVRNVTASVSSVSSNIVKNVALGFGYVKDEVSSFVSGYFSGNKLAKDDNKTANNSLDNLDSLDNVDGVDSVNTNIVNNSVKSASGIVVAPSKDSEVLDAKTKAKIKNSFSDEVYVNPDKSGTTGVITPVFKKTNGDDFVYVLVPVKEKKQ